MPIVLRACKCRIFHTCASNLTIYATWGAKNVLFVPPSTYNPIYASVIGNVGVRHKGKTAICTGITNIYGNIGYGLRWANREAWACENPCTDTLAPIEWEPKYSFVEREKTLSNTVHNYLLKDLFMFTCVINWYVFLELLFCIGISIYLIGIVRTKYSKINVEATYIAGNPTVESSARSCTIAIINY